jgi:hypothetical protein
MSSMYVYSNVPTDVYSNVPTDVLIFTFYSDQLVIDVETGIVNK